ncbi:hypothetical protein DFP72DRAFT_844621 [Ephemerocybe angulata]|uniref:Uncharacterized protein n=1 Tax=Ephemerocybe angulata TaxID=980116 RepID=A0A8H6MC87_9AGAR|nr:hypothetical protein DFP72DRAFT_844621 [Tulosesus angulatus]
MRPSLLAIGALSLLASYVSAGNSGVWTDDGRRIMQPPTYGDKVVSRRAEVPSPTPTEQLTNAERLRRHLPLLPPTRRHGALTPRASCVPLTDGTGILQVRLAVNGAVKGYISKVYDGQNSYTVSTLQDALTVDLSSTSLSGPLEISAVDGPDASRPLIGAVGGSGGFNFASGQVGYTYLSGTGHTPANSPPSSTAGSSLNEFGYTGPVESTIWFVNCLSLEVTAQWTNDDGSQFPTSVFYDPGVDYVGLVGDFNAFTSTFPTEDAYLVTLHFIPTGI